MLRFIKGLFTKSTPATSASVISHPEVIVPINSEVPEILAQKLLDLAHENLKRIQVGELLTFNGHVVTKFEYAVVLETGITLTALREAGYTAEHTDFATRYIIRSLIQRLSPVDVAPDLEKIPLDLQRVIYDTAAENRDKGWPCIVAQASIRFMFGIPDEFSLQSNPLFLKSCADCAWHIADSYNKSADIIKIENHRA